MGLGEQSHAPSRPDAVGERLMSDPALTDREPADDHGAGLAIPARFLAETITPAVRTNSAIKSRDQSDAAGTGVSPGITTGHKDKSSK